MSKVISEYIISTVNKINEEFPGRISEEQINSAINRYSNSTDDLNTVLEKIDEEAERIRESFERDVNERHYDLNDFFDCRLSHNSLHIHVIPKDIRDLIRERKSDIYAYISDRLDDALDKIPEILEDPNNSDIRHVMAVSPLLRSDRAKEVFVSKGFDVVDDIPPVFTEMFGTDRIGYVTMSKDKFMSMNQNKEKSTNQKKID